MDEMLFRETYLLWLGFKENVIYNNRFLVNHEVLDLVKSRCEEKNQVLSKDTVIYRARIYDGDKAFIGYIDSSSYIHPLIKEDLERRKTTNYWGYNEKDSFLPPKDRVKGGRANPEYISYLYAADNEYTAMVEVRPYLDSYISIAAIKILDDIKLADFSNYSYIIKDNKPFENAQAADYLIYHIMRDFQKPNNNDMMQYIPTQYISEYIKSLGFEGIKFRSSLDIMGCNFAIFATEKCEPVNSKLYQLSDIYLKGKSVVPKKKDLSPLWLEFLESLLQKGDKKK